MISNFFVAVNAVVPLFCLIFIGTLVHFFEPCNKRKGAAGAFSMNNLGLIMRLQWA